MIEEVEPSKVGTHEYPIPVPDEAEQVQEGLQLLEKRRCKHILDEAVLTNNGFELAYAVVKASKKMANKKLPHRDRELNKAINEFFSEKIGIKVGLEHFEKKRDPDYSDEDTQPSPCDIVLFGVDFLTTRGIKQYFLNNDCRVQKVAWLDESNCRVGFSTPEMARKALESHLKHQVAKDVDTDELEREWFSLKPYNVIRFERELQARYATSKEVEEPPPAEEEGGDGDDGEAKKKKRRKVNKHMKFMDAYHMLPVYLIQKFEAQQLYASIYSRMEKRDEREKEKRERRRERSRER